MRETANGQGEDKAKIACKKQRTKGHKQENVMGGKEKRRVVNNKKLSKKKGKGGET